MVFSPFISLTATQTTPKKFQNQLLVSLNLPDAVVVEKVEDDFSDVFGPLPSNVDYIEPVIDADEEVIEIFHGDVKAPRIGVEDFEILKVVGQGAFGKVFQVKKKGTSEVYAMKVMRKDKIIEKNLADYMNAEKDILTKIEHPFIVQLKYSFQVIPYHGFHKRGTPFLSALPPRPFQGHDKAADWWSVGILLYEMLTGKSPFTGGNREKIQKKIVKDKMKLPSFLSSEAHSLLKGLLQKDANKRLGNGPKGNEEIRNHKWFKPINWKKLESKQIQPSFCPEVAGKLCVVNFEKKWTDMSLLDSPATTPKAKTSINPFEDFAYVRPEAIGI
ncbi:hypothetical protein ACFE04_002320 [Oxalis oulophora]